MYKVILILVIGGLIASCSFKSPNPLSIKNEHFEAMVKTLQKLVPDSVLKKTPHDYWFYNGKDQVVRLPLVWPYSIYSINGLGNARLYDDRAVTDYKLTDKQRLLQELEYLKEFNYDGHLLIAHTSTNGGFLNNNKNPMERWVVFMFDTKQVIDCDNEKALYIKAKSLGYSGKESMMSIQDYGMLFN